MSTIRYSWKCNKCGQPYNVEQVGDFPIKDTFTRKCPTCDSELRYKASCLSTDWTFDESFKQETE